MTPVTKARLKELAGNALGLSICLLAFFGLATLTVMLRGGCHPPGPPPRVEILMGTGFQSRVTTNWGVVFWTTNETSEGQIEVRLNLQPDER
jgi:hypothetical protein